MRREETEQIGQQQGLSAGDGARDSGCRRVCVRGNGVGAARRVAWWRAVDERVAQCGGRCGVQLFDAG
jgi:hypothetical protein